MNKPIKPCHEPGCSELTVDLYCEKHKRVQRNFRSSSQMGYDYQWKKRRERWIAMHPFCEMCGALEDGMNVDHIVPHQGDMALFHDDNNLRTLCHSCHSKVTRQQQVDGTLKGWNGILGG